MIAVHNFGAGDMIEVEPAGGGPTLLVAFTQAAVPEVDVEGGRIVVVPPEEWQSSSTAGLRSTEPKAGPRYCHKTGERSRRITPGTVGPRRHCRSDRFDARNA